MALHDLASCLKQFWMQVVNRRKEFDCDAHATLPIELIALYVRAKLVVKMAAPFAGVSWIQSHICAPVELTHPVGESAAFVIGVPYALSE